jgi:hypothetical protein
MTYNGCDPGFRRGAVADPPGFDSMLRIRSLNWVGALIAYAGHGPFAA